MKHLALLLALISLPSNASELPINKVLTQIKTCSPTLVIRSQKLTIAQQNEACEVLSKQEAKFHQIFNTEGKPVKHDFNKNLRVNVYNSRDEYVKHASGHFNMPTDNGGMYLEGYPDKPGNQAEFITYEKGKVIWNLRHEYVHYLDGRFNTYGDFCAALHDSHSPPENCPKPAPLLPHSVWWSEGIAEYIAKYHDHPRAVKDVSIQVEKYKLSELFDTSYEMNGGGERVYSWGYFAVRYMIENQREKVEEMLVFLRAGDLPRYQALIRLWGTSMDKDFTAWLKKQIK
ncbi:collagenase [Aliikangiella sp. IMCC44359]|uniref:collagenase n=1 Tax=Aliikangiella sp. IMCC44359 TaxID=3459125 RepID=UPI00403B1CA3